jgi:hypothetical protein
MHEISTVMLQRLYNLTGVLPGIKALPLPSKLRLDRLAGQLKARVDRVIAERRAGVTIPVEVRGGGRYFIRLFFVCIHIYTPVALQLV